LRADKKTSPALHAKIGDTIYYGNMFEKTAGMSGSAHMSYGGKEYLLCDENGIECTNVSTQLPPLAQL